ncbi:alpha/beta fold hydrolase [Xanthomonadaceae bacterium JHOS43]|nr:alpha/beta fold hydrolase [Xanthomonadaceae bacterium JHOS43]MCX7562860.1 alpha/beta fold hydrolase [Xanthomonadaceae bacterium XH05]
MKRKVPLLLLTIVLLAGAFFSARWLMQSLLVPSPAQSAPADPAHLRIGESFLDHLDAGRYDAALAMTTHRVREALAGGKLQEVWEALPKQLGTRQSRTPLRGELVGETPTVTSTLTFGLLALDARIVVTPEGAISGFRIVPAAKAPEPAPLENNSRFTEVEFAVGERERALPGTLSVPNGEGPFPAIVLVHGSGPHDRDETIGPNTPFRDLAHGLAERGVAVLRYEKRTFARPQDFASGDFTVDDEVTDDAVAAIAQLRADARIDSVRVFVAGHSLGAMMAPRIAERAPELAGLILLAAPARPLQDIVVEQVGYLAARDGDISAEEQASIDDMSAKAAAVATLDASSPASATLLGLPPRYWMDLREYDPRTTASRLSQPILVAQGGRDYQVTQQGDFNLWLADFGDVQRVQFGLYPELNHLFIAGAGASNPEEYLIAGSVDVRVINAIAAFVGAGQ